MTMTFHEISRQLKGKLIVSCQAPEGDVFQGPAFMARFACAAVDAGAAGIRANGVEDVAAIRQAVPVPIIGIAKQMQEDGRILITPTFELARDVVLAGADLIALDCTARGQHLGALQRLGRIKGELGVPVLADIATADEARAAVDAGADLILTTMRGYTPETEHIREFDAEFVAELAQAVGVPVIAEGRVTSPEQAAAAIGAGAFAVVVGTSITRPGEIARRFVMAMEDSVRRCQGVFAIGIDLGGTNTKFAIGSQDGRLISENSWPTPSSGGKNAILDHLKKIVRHCQELARETGITLAALGVATAGWVDPDEGEVVYATGNLPGWTGTKIRAELERASGLPVGVENDANALAVAEKYFGLARNVDHFVGITLGTGVGGGCYVGGRLNRGANFMGNGIGHITLVEDGLPCTCGRRGCLEVYANAAALIRYAGAQFPSAEAVIQASNAGDTTARNALRSYAHHLAKGCSTLVHVLDPALFVFSGGIAQDNPSLLPDLEREMAAQVTAWDRRRIRLAVSPLARFGGVIGATAVALDRISHAGRRHLG